MERFQAVERLAAGGRALTCVLGNVDPEEAGWRPPAGGWSLREIAMHLLEEEKYDFRVRVDYTLHKPGTPWPSIDPEGWVSEHEYQGHDLGESVSAFREERDTSLAWLRGLHGADWHATHEHPRLGTFQAGDVLASWVAHDLLHLRQITLRLYQRVNATAEPFSTAYAGPWPDGS